ncbi:mitochondrial carrier domain-containing protein [Naematelia encephala]|uniref:Mitochondrial carrier domain-containing protein n=1 Tax=Naematelia encephala TaxID=71784 RepID=A0A1Y2BFL5_9TREE|nr:mitochondrial carrier domain-containing protein [Naematelia encephala]
MNNGIPPVLQATSGALGSAVGNALVFPLDLATTHLQLRRSSSEKLTFIQTLHRLLIRRTPRQLYSGLKADTISTLLSSFIYFFVYSSLHKFALRQRRQEANRHLESGLITSPAGIGGMTTKASEMPTTTTKIGSLGIVDELVIGLVAGIVSKGLTLPISAITIRQQLGTDHDDDDEERGDIKSRHNKEHEREKTDRETDKKNKSMTILQAIQAMYQEDGLSGMFAALPPSIPLALLPSLTLYIHTLLLRLVVPARHRAHPKGITTFLLGAASNVLATIPLYPLVLLKVISQSGRDKGKESQGGMLGALNRIMYREGVLGLYKGIEGQLVKGIVQQGVMMLLKQRIEESVVMAYRTFA